MAATGRSAYIARRALHTQPRLSPVLLQAGRPGRANVTVRFSFLIRIAEGVLLLLTDRQQSPDLCGVYLGRLPLLTFGHLSRNRS
jgi:hypothetical protein